jgi:hypothetical protein
MRTVLAILLSGSGAMAQKPVDRAQLPMSVERKVDFATDIQPLLKRSCLKCHGDKYSKSDYRMTSRESALKGGELGVAILPGDSANSPFVHYIAGLVENTEMPPEGKAPALSRGEISLVRGWIDQGAAWSQPTETVFTAEPMVRYITISGSAEAFRQHWGMTGGLSLGLGQVTATGQTKRGANVEFDGRTIGGDEDHLARLRIDRPGLGYVEVGYESWREFGLGTGGYLGGTELSPFRLDKAPYLDHGRVWLSAGLARRDVPQLDFTYERLSRGGRLATQQWGGVPVGELETRAVYPATKSVDETIHRLSLRAEHEIGDTRIEDALTIEIGDSAVERGHTEFFNLPAQGTRPDYLTQIGEEQEFKRGANSLRLTRQLKNWWRVSLGHHFTRYDGEAGLEVVSMSPNDPGEAPWMGDRSNAIRTRQRSHFLNATTLLGPWKNLTLSGGVQGESTRREGIATGLSLGASPARFASGEDRTGAEGNLQLSYTGLKNTVLTLGARLRGESTDLREDGHINSEWGAEGFMRESDETGRLAQSRAGFAWSPNREWLVRGGYRWRDSRSNFRHPFDTDLSDEPGNGYPAFINRRRARGDVIDLGFTWRRFPKFLPGFRWERHRTDYELGTQSFNEPWDGPGHNGGRHWVGKHESDVFSLSITSMPHTRLVATTSIGYTDTWSGTLESPALGLQPFEGDTWFYVDHLSYALGQASDLTLVRSYYRVDYGDSNLPGAIAYGLDAERYGIVLGLRHRLGQAAIFNVQYGWFNNDEPSANGAHDYNANMILATLSIDLN